MTSVIDDINMRTMESPTAASHYANDRGLFPSERAALDSVIDAARGKPILDIGVGGGRTVNPLLEVSRNYLGVDYSREMLRVCRQRHPGVAFEHMDAREMRAIADNSYFLAMFACNGVCMVGHEDRLLIMREVFRVLQPGGCFLFSTYNQESPQHSAGFQFPTFKPVRNPLRLPLRSASYVARSVVSLFNHARFRRHEIRKPDYSIINDTWHDYGTMQYYINAANQRRQLEGVGFAPQAVAYDDDARIIEDGSTSHSLFFVARKPA